MPLTDKDREVLDQLWTSFWPNCQVAPLPILAFIDKLLLCKQLDEEELEKERMAAHHGLAIKNPTFKESQQALRWSHFRSLHWSIVGKLFARRDGPLEFVKSKVPRSRWYPVRRHGEPFTPPAGMLAKAIEIIDQLEIGGDPHRNKLMDYLSDKAGLLKPAPKSTPRIVQAGASPATVAPGAVRRARTKKTLYLTLLISSWVLFGAYLAYNNWSQIKSFVTTIAPAPTADSTETSDSVINPIEEERTEEPAVTQKKKERKEKEKKVVTPVVDGDEDRIAETAPTTDSTITPAAYQEQSTSTDVASDPEEASNEADSKGLYKVVSKAYFHNEPDVSTRRNAFVNHWNNSYATLKALEEKNGFIYVVFRNDRQQTSKGWLRKSDLRPATDEEQ